jgi:hypothetical protein
MTTGASSVLRRKRSRIQSRGDTFPIRNKLADELPGVDE